MLERLFGKASHKPQEIAVIEGGDVDQRKLGQAPALVLRWEKVMMTNEGARDEKSKARYDKAVAQRDWWKALTDLAVSKPGA